MPSSADAGARPDGLRNAFEGVHDLTVGVEEELVAVDPDTLHPVAAPESIFPDPSRSPAFKRELWCAHVEVVTGVCERPQEAVIELARARRALLAALSGVRLAGIGVHPFARPWIDVSPGERYAEIVQRHAVGARVGGIAGGLHVHVAVRGAERALAVWNAMRGLMPLFVGVAANSPFVAGLDSGLATVRPKLCDALPRQGVAPRFASWSAVEDFVDWAVRTGAIADTSELWWECRMNHRLGTIELRAPDAQASLEDVHALVALAHATVADLCDRYDGGETLAAFDTVRIQENRWRAARFGLDGPQLDLAGGETVHGRELLDRHIARIERCAARFGEGSGLERTDALARRNVPAARRALAARHGLRAVVEQALADTEP